MVMASSHWCHLRTTEVTQIRPPNRRQVCRSMATRKLPGGLSLVNAKEELLAFKCLNCDVKIEEHGAGPSSRGPARTWYIKDRCSDSFKNG